MNLFEKLLAKFVAKKLIKKLDLYEGPKMEGKPWYKSKGVVTGIVTVLVGAYESTRLYLAPQMGWSLPEIPPFVFAVLGTLGVYARAVASGPVTK